MDVAVVSMLTLFSSHSRFWNNSVNGAAWVTILIVFVILINTFGIKAFGEVEFWLSLIKILTLTGLILLG